MAKLISKPHPQCAAMLAKNNELLAQALTLQSAPATGDKPQVVVRIRELQVVLHSMIETTRWLMDNGGFKPNTLPRWREFLTQSDETLKRYDLILFRYEGTD